MQWLPLELAFFAVHAVWWEKFKNGGVRERWEELKYPISSETRKKIVLPRHGEIFYFRKSLFTG